MSPVRHRSTRSPPVSRRWRTRRARDRAGLLTRDRFGIPDVMRGEETQLVGAVAATEPSVLGGAAGHAQQMGARRARPRDRLRDVHDGRALRGAARDTACSAGWRSAPRTRRSVRRSTRGARRGLDPGGLTHAMFGARTLVLTGDLAPTDVDDWLSGLLIGREIARRACVGERQGRAARRACGSSATICSPIVMRRHSRWWVSPRSAAIATRLRADCGGSLASAGLLH